jgi:outer membrane protein assembly factor BamB
MIPLPRLLLCSWFSLTALSAATPSACQLVRSPEEGWPQWRGPQRDGISRETGLLTAWPEGGPPRLWKAEGIGRGYASPILAGGKLFIAGDEGEHLVVHALDLEGRPLWRAINGAAWKTPYPGARGTCAYRDGRVYHRNAHGRVACFDAADGREIWAVDTLARFDGQNITWALSEGLLVDGDLVFVTAGGSRALMVALDRHTGETRWQSPPLRLGGGEGEVRTVTDPAEGSDAASYASPILFTRGDQRILAGASLRHLFGVDASTGALLWSRPMPTTYAVIAATPVLSGCRVFGTAPDGQGGLCLELEGEGDRLTAREVWRSELDTCQGSLFAVGDSIYGPWYRGRRGWVRLDAATGKVRYDTREVAIGSGIFVDGRLLAFGQDGEAALLEPLDDRFAVRGRFSLTERRVTDAWAHPVVWQGRLYLRYHDALHCFDLRPQ